MSTGRKHATSRTPNGSFGRVIWDESFPARSLGILRWSQSHAIEVKVFLAWWTERFGDVLPLGHMLRTGFPDRWFRIHSLPDSKRYASDEGEHQVLLERQEQLADSVLGRESCFVVIPCSPSWRWGREKRSSNFQMLAIAEDRLRALWINRTTNAIFAPYDGGVDVVVQSHAQRDILKEDFSEWLPAHISGL